MFQNLYNIIHEDQRHQKWIINNAYWYDSFSSSKFFDVLARRHNAIKVSPKILKAELRKIHGTEALNTGKVSVEEVADELLRSSLELGRNVVNEGILNKKDQRNRVRRLAANSGMVNVVLLEIETPLSVIEERLRDRYTRSSHLVDSGMVCAFSQLENMEWPHDTGETYLRLDGAQSIFKMVQSVDRYVRELPQV